MTTKVQIVILNGVGSSGKSSIAKALQTITRESFLHVEMDTFCGMLPEASWGQSEGITFETSHIDGNQVTSIRIGPAAEAALRGMRHAIAAMAAQGNNLIVDDVILGDEFAEYTKLLSAFDVFWVGVFAPLNVLEERERARGDRRIGLARWQYGRVHKGVEYDLEIDASAATPLELAEQIKQKFGLLATAIAIGYGPTLLTQGCQEGSASVPGIEPVR